MAIDFTSDILPFFTDKVVTDPAYQVPGTFSLPANFGNTPAEQRLLTFIELYRSYLSQVDNNHEAKLLQVVMARMMAAMKFGSTPWNTTTMPADAQKAALRYIADHVLATDL